MCVRACVQAVKSFKLQTLHFLISDWTCENANKKWGRRKREREREKRISLRNDWEPLKLTTYPTMRSLCVRSFTLANYSRSQSKCDDDDSSLLLHCCWRLELSKNHNNSDNNNNKQKGNGNCRVPTSSLLFLVCCSSYPLYVFLFLQLLLHAYGCM